MLSFPSRARIRGYELADLAEYRNNIIDWVVMQPRSVALQRLVFGFFDLTNYAGHVSSVLYLVHAVALSTYRSACCRDENAVRIPRRTIVAPQRSSGQVVTGPGPRSSHES